MIDYINEDICTYSIVTNFGRYDLEMHLVHTSDHKETAVVAILYKFGRPDRFLSKVRTVSREQVRALKTAIHDGLKTNARPTQALDGRRIQFYTPHK
uniref:Alpha-carbonic anhydrase domain-containing protein n=1 Tax=Cucumis sativus TaxID=3659 RepID=A0A0A0L1S5_CUCSA